jgi:excisionase family DNA binding protein
VEDRRDYLTVSQVAERYGVSDDYVRAQIRKGALPAYMVGEMIRIRRLDAEAWVQPVTEPSSTAAVEKAPL